MQINYVTPTGLTAGDTAIQMSIGGVASNAAHFCVGQ
jgi:uncharacterized protein (TIGR03437 family)